MAKYTVRYERDEDGVWVGTIKEVAGVHTQGRSVETVRRRIREALATAVKDADTAQLEDEFAVGPAAARRALAALKKARARAQVEEKRIAELQRTLAMQLVREEHMSVRDAGAVLALTGGRVQQMVKS